MSEILRAEGLQKTFRLSAKQQKLEKTRSRTKVDQAGPGGCPHRWLQCHPAA